jgi:peptidoglycan/xylan/chitin deacetylase (PgdA/CDA1 family)/predicted esterase
MVVALRRLLWGMALLCQTGWGYGAFDEWVRSSETIDSHEDIAQAKQELMAKYRQAVDADTERKTQHEARAIKFMGKTMRFSLEKRGQAPKEGFPVYIALHGGGSGPAAMNDSQWHHMKVYYRDSVEQGIYIAPRGVSDTWDLHFQSESYPLYDRLIENLIVYEGADPNRIYLLGFSAGGDGVYQVVPRMPDRWAGANMSAGHHNWIGLDNLMNTPFLLQMGEYDSAYQRNRVAVENSLKLDALQQQHSGYKHTLFMHANRGHNGWLDYDPQNRMQPILAHPKQWLEQGDRTTTTASTSAVHWLKEHKRSTSPTKLIWDIGTRAPRSYGLGASYVENQSIAIAKQQDLFYWLKIDSDTQQGRLEVERHGNTVTIHKAQGVKSLTIRLDENTFDFQKPVKVYYQGQAIATQNPQARRNIMAQTLLERGDPEFIFHDEITVIIPTTLRETTANDRFSYCSNGRCMTFNKKELADQRQYPLTLNHHCVNDRHYAMTFDDGPSHQMYEILKVLREHEVDATFFVVGQNIETDEAKDLLQKMHQEGHQIANHTYSHRSLLDLNAEEVREELEKTQTLIDDALGYRGARFIRPPFGYINPMVQRVIEEQGFQSVRWNSDRYDWNLGNHDESLVVERVKQHLDFIKRTSLAGTQSILDLNHDRSSSTLKALPTIIPMIKEAGYQFVTMNDCLR